MDSTHLVGRMAAGDGQAELAEDLMVEILARLPVKSLSRFKSVSKPWYSLIVSTNFTAIHYTHSHSKKIVSLFCCKTNRYMGTDLDVSFLFGDVPGKLAFGGNMDCVEIVGCFNGVVCLYLPGRFILWNPATAQIRMIDSDVIDPDALFSDRPYEYGFCIDPVTNAFRVAQIKVTATRDGGRSARVHMFSTATDSWTTKKNIGLPSRIESEVSTAFVWAICVNRYMYWLVGAYYHDGKNLPPDVYILSYDMIDEVFKRVELPVSNSFTCDPRLANYKGYLAMFLHKQELASNNGNDISYAEVEVWVMDDCVGANQSWSKLLTCTPAIKVRNAVGFFRMDDTDYVILEMDQSGCLYLHDLEQRETKYVSGMFPYSESLVSLE